jgi:hypothetical protein
MIVTGVQAHEIEQIVELVSKDQYNGSIELKSLNTLSRNRASFTIRARDSRAHGARRSWQGRRTIAACWHAHWDVLAKLFEKYPHATVKTALATYTAETFERRALHTAEINIGSMMQPAYMTELCDCIGHVSGT